MAKDARPVGCLMPNFRDCLYSRTSEPCPEICQSKSNLGKTIDGQLCQPPIDSLNPDTKTTGEPDMTESTPTETVEARIRRIMGDVDITYSGGTTTYIQPEDLRAGRIFRYIKSDVKTIDERKTNVWILTDLESGASCEMIESAQLSKHTPQEGQVFFLRFDGCQEIAGGKRVNNFTLNLYSVKARA